MLWYLEEFVSISKMPGLVGWDGMGREGMSWDGSGVGAGYHVEKHDKILRLSPTNHTRVSFWLPFVFGGVACGTLGAPVCVPFCHLGGYWCPLGPKLQKDTKIERTHELKLMPKGMYF